MVLSIISEISYEREFLITAKYEKPVISTNRGNTRKLIGFNQSRTLF